MAKRHMRRIGAALIGVGIAYLAAISSAQAAGDDFAEKYRQVNETQRLRLQSSPSREELLAAGRERRAALEALAAEIEAVEPEQRDLDSLKTLAAVYADLARHEEAIVQARLALMQSTDDPDLHVILISSLALAKQPGEASTSLEEAQRKFPDSMPLRLLHDNVARAFTRADQSLAAAEHWKKNTDFELERLIAAPDVGRVPVASVKETVTAFERSGKADAALAELDKRIEAVTNLNEKHPTPALTAGIVELRSFKAGVLARAGHADEARALIAELLKDARQVNEAHPDAATTKQLIALLKTEYDIASVAGADDAGALREAYLEFLVAALRRPTIDRETVRAWLDETTSIVNELAEGNDESAANARLDAAEELLASLTADDPASVGLVRAAQANLKSARRRMEGILVRTRLIDTPAIPIEAEAWVNGTPLDTDDLRGKVVLLDFWAVWCGPCIATFPHLRDWHERFADDGLVIVGLTQYYGYDWNAEAERAVAATDEISHATEEAAVAEFAKHHQLGHRLALMPEGSELSSRYGVVGIPQAVLIDRQGVVRMIRVGSGEENAHDLEQMIEQLLAEQATAAAGGS